MLLKACRSNLGFAYDGFEQEGGIEDGMSYFCRRVIRSFYDKIWGGERCMSLKSWTTF